MKAKLFLFGLPIITEGKLSIDVYKNPEGNRLGTRIYKGENSTKKELKITIDDELSIGDKINLQIMSSGICIYVYKLEFLGGDISHVPTFIKETNMDDEWVEKDWNLNVWTRWNPTITHTEGIVQQNNYITSGKINLEPIWKTYHRDSQIDYFEKFHKLWIGFNAYATYFSSNRKDTYKILDLVNSDIKDNFNHNLESSNFDRVINSFRNIQHSTGVDMSSEVLNLNITNPSSIIDFLEECKKQKEVFQNIDEKLFEGMLFLENEEGDVIFNNLYSIYHGYMASEEGIVEPYELSEVFNIPKAPGSINQIGRLVFHNHLEGIESGSMFSLENYFGNSYSLNQYNGASITRYQEYENIDPLFYKYLILLYQFRNAYFHGDFIMNSENNKLAKYAYLSLLEIYPTV